MRYTWEMNRRLTRISKYLSFVLKHHPESIGLELDGERWSNLEELVTKANASGKTVAAEQIHQIIAESDEKRFELSDDQLKIRAI
jgi:putative RNA 2'-phosphotransferase